MQEWKGRKKLSLLVNNIIVYVENLQNSAAKFVALTREFSQVFGCKMSIEKPVAFLKTANKGKTEEVIFLKEEMKAEFCDFPRVSEKYKKHVRITHAAAAVAKQNNSYFNLKK